ncbi:MAG: MerR family transcriptional regulator [Piscirickettsiaceae bacterium]|nr:MAG: MerR family transcriptional regulator [Piscirickettsiaceae bacterium]
MTDKNLLLFTGEVVEESEPLTLSQMSHICGASVERIVEIVEEGIVEPYGENIESWRFQGLCVQRVRFVLRMERDLGVNAAGSALALELLEELELLRGRLQRLDHESN